jgi:hypothetical protein
MKLELYDCPYIYPTQGIWFAHKEKKEGIPCFKFGLLMKQAKDNNICRLKRDSHFNFILFYLGACRPMASWVSENITAACTKAI